MSRLKGFVETENYLEFENLIEALQEADDRSPKLGIVEGTWGHGKSSSLDNIEAKYNAYVARVEQSWTFTGATSAICNALEITPRGRAYLNMELIKEKILKEDGKFILIVDEADQLFNHRSFKEGEKVFQLFRDLHDFSRNVIIILMGEIGLRKKLEALLGKAYESRIRDGITLAPPTVTDFQLQSNNFDIKLDKSLFEYFEKYVQNLRLTQTIFENIRKYCKENSIEDVITIEYYEECIEIFEKGVKIEIDKNKKRLPK